MTISLQHIPLIQTERTQIFTVHTDFAEQLLDYKIKNKAYLEIYEPEREASYYTLSDTIERVKNMQQDMHDKKCLSLIAMPKDSQKMIASINFTNFIYGAFQACYLGYSIDQDYEGKGIMFEIAQAAIDHVKENLPIHRIMANHLVDNHRSAKLLKRLGFEKEGYARAYVRINGKWQDHILNALIFDEHEKYL